MKYWILGLTLIYCTAVFAQHHSIWEGYSNTIFVENANVRSAPSLEGKIIGVLKHNTTIEQNYSEVGKGDTIAGVSDFWLPIKYQNTKAFIWSPVLAQNVFTSDLISKKTFLFKFSGTRNAEFKIFEADQLVQQYSFYKKVYTNAVSWNMGKTLNSNGNDVIVVKYYNDTLSGYDLFEWNGEVLTPSKIRLIDDSFITQKYIEFTRGVVNKNGVNLRVAPDSKSASVAVVSKNTMLQLVAENVKDEKLSVEKFGTWHAVKWKGKEVYVWSEFFDLPYRYIRSNVKENEAFLLTNNAVYAFVDRKIVSRVATYSQSDDDFIYDGNKGFSEAYQFLAICMKAEACGETSGDNYILWKDGKLRHFACDCGTGDGGYSETGSVTFPNQLGGIKDKVIFYDESSEYDESALYGEYNAIKSSSTKIMEFLNDSLVEVPSEHSKIRSFIAKNFTQYELSHYGFFRLNNDTINDVVFFLSPSYTEEGASFIKSIVGYALSDSLGNYIKPLVSTEIVQKDFFSVQYRMDEGILKIVVKYGLSLDGDLDKAYYTNYNYKYDQLLNSMVWHSVSSGKNVGDEEKFKWGEIKTSYFRSKKIKFENTWDFFENGLPAESTEE